MEKIKPFETVGSDLYTMFPNVVLDFIMPQCKPNTWKIVCITIRKTIGWHKEEDQISISQYRKLSGIASKETCHKAIEDAVNNGYLLQIPYKNTFKYSLNKNYEMEIGTETVPFQNGTETVLSIGTETVHTKERLKKEKEGKIFSMLQGLGIFNNSLAQMVGWEIKDWDEWTANLPDNHKDKDISGIDAMLHACEEAVKVNATTFNFVTKCFDNWKSGGFGYNPNAKKNGNQPRQTYAEIYGIPNLTEERMKREMEEG